jgi:hypothetical protein
MQPTQFTGRLGKPTLLQPLKKNISSFLFQAVIFPVIGVM